MLIDYETEGFIIVYNKYHQEIARFPQDNQGEEAVAKFMHEQRNKECTQ